MKKLLKIGMITGLVCAFTVSPIMVNASNINEQATESYVEDTEYSVQRASLLSYGNSRLKKLSSNSVSVYGVTQCHRLCDDVYLSLYLERKVDGYYSTYKSWDYSTTDATSLSKSLVVSVPSGYYYRVRAYHAVSDSGSSKESISTLTEGIYVG